MGEYDDGEVMVSGEGPRQGDRGAVGGLIRGDEPNPLGMHPVSRNHGSTCRQGGRRRLDGEDDD